MKIPKLPYGQGTISKYNDNLLIYKKTTDVEIVGVFTSPSLWLSNASGTNCYKKDNAMKYLKSDRFMGDKGLDPKALDEALQPRIVRAKNPKDEKQEEAES